MENWRAFGLHEGWTGLILSMMWETAQGPESKWAEYLRSSPSSPGFPLYRLSLADVLPTSFDTPMFWDDKDLAELQGTSIVRRYPP